MGTCSNCVKVTGNRLQVIIALGCTKGGVATAEQIEDMLDIPLDEVLEALDGLESSDVVEGIDEFCLTEEGSELFNAIYDATGKVVK